MLPALLITPSIVTILSTTTLAYLQLLSPLQAAITIVTLVFIPTTSTLAIFVLSKFLKRLDLKIEHHIKDGSVSLQTTPDTTYQNGWNVKTEQEPWTVVD